MRVGCWSTPGSNRVASAMERGRGHTKGVYHAKRAGSLPEKRLDRPAADEGVRSPELVVEQHVGRQAESLVDRRQDVLGGDGFGLGIGGVGVARAVHLAAADAAASKDR